MPKLSSSAVLSVSLAGPLLLPDCPSSDALHHNTAACDGVIMTMQLLFQMHDITHGYLLDNLKWLQHRMIHMR